MKVRLGYNTQYAGESPNEIVDIADYGYTDEEWVQAPEEEKYEVAENWAYENGLEIYFEDINE